MDPSLISLPSTLPFFERLDIGMDYFYFQGGIRGVILADVFQALVLLTGLLVIIIKVNFLLIYFAVISNVKFPQRGKLVSFFSTSPCDLHIYRH